MTARYPILYRLIQLLALAAVMTAVFAPGLLAAGEVAIALSLIVLGGIPHGATDHLIFHHLDPSVANGRRLTRFYLRYLLLIAGYSLLWWWAPWLALGLFLALSIYHFGQSNWNYVRFRGRTEAIFTFAIWGALIVSAPLLFHYEAASGIVTGITGAAPPHLQESWRWALFGALLLVNCWWMSYLTFYHRISPTQLRDEWINLGVLCLTFYLTPLLLGFAIYFVFWHSLSSILDQIRFFRQHLIEYDWRQYMRHTLPFSLLAVSGLAGMGWLATYLGLGLNIGMLFIFISVITLPHMLLIDQLYEAVEQESQVRKNEKYSSEPGKSYATFQDSREF